MKKFRYLAPVLVILLGTFFFLRSNKKNNPQQSYKSVRPIEFKALSEKDNTFLLDVHIPEQSHIPGTDAFIPYNEIDKKLDKLPEDKNTTILVYCRSGSMSKEAADVLSELGYKNIYDLEGGINAYKDQISDVLILPSTKDLGEVIYGDVVKTDYELFNFSKNVLKITEISTSCGCTKASMDEKEIEPYSSALIHVSFDPAVHKDDTDLGHLSRTIYIKTDNPNFSQVTTGFTANVIKK